MKHVDMTNMRYMQTLYECPIQVQLLINDLALCTAFGISLLLQIKKSKGNVAVVIDSDAGSILFAYQSKRRYRNFILFYLFWLI